MTNSPDKPMIQISAKIREDHWHEIKAIARRNETNANIELRRAIRAHIEAEGRQPA